LGLLLVATPWNTRGQRNNNGNRQHVSFRVVFSGRWRLSMTRTAPAFSRTLQPHLNLQLVELSIEEMVGDVVIGEEGYPGVGGAREKILITRLTGAVPPPVVALAGERGIGRREWKVHG